MALRVALYLALPSLAEPRAAAEHAAAAVAAVAEHFRVQGSTRRLQDPFANLDAACRAELQPTVETLESPACQAEMKGISLFGDAVLTNQRVEEMCTSTCFQMALDLIDHDCFAEMAGDSDAGVALSAAADLIRSMCVKNEHGDYCGTKFGVLQSNVQGSEQCGVFEDMGCCFAEVAHVMTIAMEQLAAQLGDDQRNGQQSIDFAAVWAAMCKDHDIETEKCPDHFGLSTGAIVGIVLGSLAGVACLAVLIFFAIRAGKQAPPAAAQPGMLLGQPQPQHAKEHVAWPQEP